ncbi:MAG: 30S ribosome-binding factor RbfA [Patescibacteria group bacterium]
MRRTQQVAAVLRKELAPLVDEILGQQFGIVTLVDVIIQPDLKEAKVYISCLDKSVGKPVLKVLEKRAKGLQHVLGKRMRMKFTPKLTFLLDRSLENVIKVEELLDVVGKDIKDGEN